MTDLVWSSQGYYKGKFMMPNQCPYCQRNNHVQPQRVLELPISVGDTAVLVSTKCNECGKNYIVIFQKSSDGRQLDFLQLVPILSEEADLESLFELSPAFEEIHRQTTQAYQMGFGRLAVIGFRTALEILMKDFVIFDLDKDKGADDIGKLNLNNLIQQYFKVFEEKDFARAIQALGNDSTHYINKHPDYSAKDVESYYRMFVSIIKSRYECRRIGKTVK